VRIKKPFVFSLENILPFKKFHNISSEGDLSQIFVEGEDMTDAEKVQLASYVKVRLFDLVINLKPEDFTEAAEVIREAVKDLLDGEIAKRS
jgi:hypothetical protein